MIQIWHFICRRRLWRIYFQMNLCFDKTLLKYLQKLTHTHTHIWISKDSLREVLHLLTWSVTSPSGSHDNGWEKMSTTPTVMLRPSLNILKRGLDNSALTFLWRSGRAGGLAFSQSLEVDRQRLLLWVWRASIVLLGDHVAHDPPKTHKEDSQDVGQHPLWDELRVCGPESKKQTERERIHYRTILLCQKKNRSWGQRCCDV